MATTPKQVNGSNGPLGKRKKSRGSKGSYLSKWLDKSMHHMQDATPSVETYEPFMYPPPVWPSPVNGSQFTPGYDPYRYIYGCAEPMSLPTLPTYCNPLAPPLYNQDYRYIQSVNKSIQVQRPRMRRRSDNKVEEVHSTPNSTLSNSNYLQPKNFTDSQDYTSLPPIVTSVADTNSISDVNNEKDDGSNARRFSDPCVRGLPDVARPANGEVDSDSESSSNLSGSQVGSRLLTHLLDQIKCLKIANERLTKDLMDTKVELENVRQQNVILQKGSSSSIGATSHTPLDNGLLGGQYSPGFLSELVREIRDAARVREEAMYARVRAMVHERNDNNIATSDAKFAEKALEEIKNSLRSSDGDRRRVMDRVGKLEDELRSLRVANGVDTNESQVSGTGSLEDGDGERLRLRRELADARKAKQAAEEHALKLERLVTQLRSKFNGVQAPNGPESLASDAEQETARVRRTSLNSTSNSQVLFGPVTDL